MRVLTGAFLSVELALAMILIAQVAVATYVANQPMPTDANINTTEVMTATISLPAAAYPNADRRQQFFTNFDQRLAGRASIVATSRATILPGESGSPRRLQVLGQEQAAGTPPPAVLTIDVAPRYFETMAITLLRGRDFTTLDGTPGSDVAIVNELFAEVFLNGNDPMGAQIALTPVNAPATAPPRWLTIVGVAPAIRQQSFDGTARQASLVYVPITGEAPVTSTVMARHRLDPEAAASLLRAEAQAVDPNVALYRMRTLKQVVREGQWTRHTSAVLADTVTYMSLLLAMVGLYAVTAQRVTLKTREIGLRMALGARSPQIARVIIAGLRVPLLAGVLLGTAGAMAWDGSFSSGLAGVYASAPPTLLKIAGFIVVIVIVSCFIPLRRATATNPIAALRHD